MISPGSLTGSVPDPDEAIRLQRDVQRTAQETASARSLQQSQIGAGGLLINGGGSLTISGTGSLNVGSGALNSAGSISAGTTITAGGTISTSGAIVGNSVSTNALSTGSASVTGNANVGGQVFVPNSFAAVSGYTVAYINSDGRLSLGASAAKFKQDFEPVNDVPLVEGILRAPLLRFRLIAAVEELGDDAALEIGLLADYLLKIGLGEFVYTDAEGEVRGINYERLTIPLIATVQALDARLRAITERLDAAGI